MANAVEDLLIKLIPNPFSCEEKGQRTVIEVPPLFWKRGGQGVSWLKKFDLFLYLSK